MAIIQLIFPRAVARTGSQNGFSSAERLVLDPIEGESVEEVYKFGGRP